MLNSEQSQQKPSEQSQQKPIIKDIYFACFGEVPKKEYQNNIEKFIRFNPDSKVHLVTCHKIYGSMIKSDRKPWDYIEGWISFIRKLKTYSNFVHEDIQELTFLDAYIQKGINFVKDLYFSGSEAYMSVLHTKDPSLNDIEARNILFAYIKDWVKLGVIMQDSTAFFDLNCIVKKEITYIKCPYGFRQNIVAIKIENANVLVAEISECENNDSFQLRSFGEGTIVENGETIRETYISYIQSDYKRLESMLNKYKEQEPILYIIRMCICKMADRIHFTLYQDLMYDICKNDTLKNPAYFLQNLCITRETVLIPQFLVPLKEKTINVMMNLSNDQIFYIKDSSNISTKLEKIYLGLKSEFLTIEDIITKEGIILTRAHELPTDRPSYEAAYAIKNSLSQVVDEFNNWGLDPSTVLSSIMDLEGNELSMSAK